jgi:hypothetical protein
MADEGGAGTAWSALAGVERWAAEARARDAVDARIRERWLRRQAEEEAAFAGLLLDLAERGATAVLTTTGGRRHVGRIEAVGADFAAVRTGADRTTLVALDTVAAVRIGAAPRSERPRQRGVGGRGGEGGPGTPGEPALGPAADARSGRSLAVTMADVLAHAVARRPRLHLHAGAAAFAGELRSVGADVVTLLSDGDPSGLAYVSLTSVSEISLLDSG